MYSNRLFRAPVICAARDPTAKSRGSREPRDQACMLIVSPRNLTGNSAELLPRYLSNLRAIGRKSKVPISQSRDPTKSRGGTTARPAEEGPDVLRVEMSAKANLPLAQTPPPTDLMTVGHISLKFLPRRYVSIDSVSEEFIEEGNEFVKAGDKSVKAREDAP